MKRVDVVTVTVFIAFIFGLALADVIGSPAEISTSERRKLAQAPEFSLTDVLDGSYTRDYAAFLQDQIVFRDGFRGIKALVELWLLRKGENNGVYVVEGNLYDQFYGINQRYVDRAGTLIEQIIESIDTDLVYLSVIPSKAHVLDRGKYLLSDQTAISADLVQRTSASYIDLMDLVEDGGADLYYRTDHHWTTQGAIEAYQALVTGMGYVPVADYDFERLTDAYVGSNYGKAALRSIARDSIYLAHNPHLDAMSVCRYQTAEAFECFDSVYFRKETSGLDAYDVFLGGAGPIIVIENDRIESSQELVVFKDSYAHVLAPFLAQHFKRVILFDLRYVRRELIFDRFDLGGTTVLFLYSTTILNTDPRILN